MRINRYTHLLKRPSICVFSIRIIRAMGYRIFRRTPSTLFSFKELPYDPRLPDGYEIKLRPVMPDEAASLVDSQISIPAKILKDRFSQGACMYGAEWQGRIIDYLWVAGAPGFRETGIGLTLRLARNQVYTFDYKGIIEGRPAAFSCFRLMKALGYYSFIQESKKIGEQAVFFTLVDEGNRISQAFFRRIVKAKPIERIDLYRVLGLCWAQRGKKC